MLAHGEPMLWATGGGLAICLVMIVGLLVLVVYQGSATFWPSPIVSFKTFAGQTIMGEVTRQEHFLPQEHTFTSLSNEATAAARTEMGSSDGQLRRRLVRTGNFELTNEHFQWINDFEIVPGSETKPEWAIIFERLAWGRFYGLPRDFLIDGESRASQPDQIWSLYRRYHAEVRKRWKARRHLEIHDLGKINRETEKERLRLREIELDHGHTSPQWHTQQARVEEVQARVEVRFQEIRREIAALNQENDKYALVVVTADGTEKILPLTDIVRAYPANRISGLNKIGIYFSRWIEFLTDDPREANSEGGVFPAIFGTVIMTLIMSVLVVPFGILAALYLREYAKAGPLVSSVRISINNLAGVPSIVFGVFGLGFFCYIIGGSIDQLFFAAKLPSPTFGTGGILWASLTLALLTLPVVIVATEEALAAVPGSMREGSYACGASKWQTIRRIVLPRAMPGIMTGTILAMARGAGEVAPLMLVGAVKLAPELPVDGTFPYVHPERSFMHLGFHIYDLGFQSQNSEAAKPMVFTTTLLLIVIITFLNIAAIWLRSRLRKKYEAAQF
jgi:phosphate transport system permease protein